jgi:hypothetical protein
MRIARLRQGSEKRANSEGTPPEPYFRMDFADREKKKQQDETSDPENNCSNDPRIYRCGRNTIATRRLEFRNDRTFSWRLSPSIGCSLGLRLMGVFGEIVRHYSNANAAPEMLARQPLKRSMPPAPRATPGAVRTASETMPDRRR